MCHTANRFLSNSFEREISRTKNSTQRTRLESSRRITLYASGATHGRKKARRIEFGFGGKNKSDVTSGNKSEVETAAKWQLQVHLGQRRISIDTNARDVELWKAIILFKCRLA